MEEKTEMPDTLENERVSYEIKVAKNGRNKIEPENASVSSLEELDKYLDMGGEKYINITSAEDARNVWTAIIGLCEDKIRYKGYVEKVLKLEFNKEKKNLLQALKEMAEEVGITDINIDIGNSENIAEALTKISIAQEQKKQNKINSSKSLEKNEVSTTVKLENGFKINLIRAGVEGVAEHNITILKNFSEIPDSFKEGEKCYISNEPKNIRNMCNAILYYQATLGKDSDEYKEFIKNFINELNDEKYKKVGCSDIKMQFINEFQRIGKSEGVNIDFQDFGYNGIAI